MTSRLIFTAALLMANVGPAAAQSEVEVPYWASLSVDQARMRKGPSPPVPVMREYRRQDLPVKIIPLQENAPTVENPDGTQGQMAAHPLDPTRPPTATAHN